MSVRSDQERLKKTIDSEMKLNYPKLANIMDVSVSSAKRLAKELLLKSCRGLVCNQGTASVPVMQDNSSVGVA